MKKILLSIIAVVFLFACSPESDYRERSAKPDRLHRSVKQVTDVIVHDIFSPPVASRIYAYMSIAGYEAAIPADKRFQSLAGQLNGLQPAPKPEEGAEYCYELAATEAMLKVGRTLVFSEDKMDVFYNNLMKEFQDTGIRDDVYTRSIDYGRKVADHIIAWSGKDTYKQSRSFPK